ncbi:hypothetical protein [Actinomyces sp. ZJ308]|uniref:hypothetical protein n=1 Tax=Actinomyces sp. ZJ308 TaxID=2708342 RepID=UPI001423424E|nr:hypothetical protein [Actinomyces sp. ZJ308]
MLGRLGADLIETTAGAGARTHRLRLALTQAGDSGGPLRLLRAPARVLAEHRAAREMAARSQLDAGPRRWVVTALAAATAATSLWIFFTVVPPLVADLNQRLTGLPPHHWFAGILEMLATVWESMSPTEKAALALIGTAAVLLSGGTLGLALEVGFGIATVMDAARPAASLARDPRGATGRYLATHSDLEIAADAALAAAAVIPGGRAAGTTARTAAKARRTTKPASRYAKDIPELFRQHEARKAAKQAARKDLADSIPEGYSPSDFSRRKMERKTVPQLRAAGHSPREIDQLRDKAKAASTTHKQLNDSGARIGEAGGEKYLTEQGYHIPDEFRADNVGVNGGTAPGGWADGMALSPDGSELVVSEYKGVSAKLNTTPVNTRFEGKALQGSPAYARDHMLSDPRFAQYFHDHPEVWEGVKDGSIKLNAKTIYTRTPELTEVGDQPFSLTPEVTQALQQAIDSL